MIRAICFAAVIASCFSQNYRNFYTSNIRFTKPVPRTFFSIPQSSNSLGVGSTDNDNLFEETRKQADAVKSTLRKLASNPEASRYMKKIFQAGDCVQTVEEAIAAIESGASIIESAKPELTRLLTTIKTIDDSSDIIKVTKTSAQILRQMESLIPKLAPANQNFCGSTFDVAYETLKTLGDVLYEVSEDRSLDLAKVTKLELKISREVVNSVTVFLEEMRDNFADLKSFCTSHKGYNVRAIQAIGSMLNGLADLFRSLGDKESEMEIREKTNLTNKIAVSIMNKFSSASD